MRIGSIFGIAVTVNVSWIFVFALVAWVLANPVGPLHLQGVATPERVALGVGGSLLFFASVLLHELSHSLLARRRGLPVKGITLFIFGGVSQIEGAAQNAPVEAWVAGIGPLTSLVLGGGFYAVASALGPATHAGAMFEYLAAANVVLAIFNLLPAYPLDGGRVLHALLWKLSGNRARATRTTGAVGRTLAAMMIAYGILETLTYDPFGGLWITFIGWFLLQAGNAERSGEAVSRAIAGHAAGELIAPPELRLPADSTAARALVVMLQTQLRVLPVYVGESFVGAVALSELLALPEAERTQTYVTAVMARPEALATLPADTSATDAIARLAGSGAGALVLTSAAGEVIGLLTRESVMSWIAGMRHAEPREV
jgi:Zn-dependent protease